MRGINKNNTNYSKRIIKKAENNNNADQRYKARITAEQQQKEYEESKFTQRYNTKTLPKKEQPNTSKEDVENVDPSATEIDSIKKVKGKKKFLTFIKELRMRSTWKKMALHALNLFKTRALIREELFHINLIKSLKWSSIVGSKNKCEDKLLTVRIAHLLQKFREVRKLVDIINKAQKAFLIAKSQPNINDKEPNLTTHRKTSKEHVISEISQTHSTLTTQVKQQTEQQSFKHIVEESIKTINYPNKKNDFQIAHIMQSGKQNFIPVSNVISIEPLINVISAAIQPIVKKVQTIFENTIKTNLPTVHSNAHCNYPEPRQTVTVIISYSIIQNQGGGPNTVTAQPALTLNDTQPLHSRGTTNTHQQ